MIMVYGSCISRFLSAKFRYKDFSQIYSCLITIYNLVNEDVLNFLGNTEKNIGKELPMMKKFIYSTYLQQVTDL